MCKLWKGFFPCSNKSAKNAPSLFMEHTKIGAFRNNLFRSPYSFPSNNTRRIAPKKFFWIRSTLNIFPSKICHFPFKKHSKNFKNCHVRPLLRVLLHLRRLRRPPHLHRTRGNKEQLHLERGKETVRTFTQGKDWPRPKKVDLLIQNQ